LLLIFEIEVTRPYSWWVRERMKWKPICQAQDVMINGKTCVCVADGTHEDEKHEDDVAPYGRHGLYEGRGEAVGAWKNRRYGVATALRSRRRSCRCTLQKNRPRLIESPRLQATTAPPSESERFRWTESRGCSSCGQTSPSTSPRGLRRSSPFVS